MRRVLARLAKLLIGDKKAEVASLFTVQLSLEKSGRIELRPDVQVAPNSFAPCFWYPLGLRLSLNSAPWNQVSCSALYESPHICSLNIKHWDLRRRCACMQEVFAMVERLIGRAIDVAACLHRIAEPSADAATMKLAEVIKSLCPFSAWTPFIVSSCRAPSRSLSIGTL